MGDGVTKAHGRGTERAVARRRFEQLPRQRQDEILGVAADAFARSGFHGTSYNQLLERLQIGKSSAYYYFDDKRDLFLTVLQRCYATYFDAMRALERPRSKQAFWDFVLRASSLGYRAMLEDPTSAAIMACMQREKALLGELGTAELLSSMDGFYDEVIAEGQRLGAIRTDLPHVLLRDVVRDAAMSFDRWFVADRDRGAQATTPEEAARVFADVVRRICEPVAKR